MKKLAMPTCDEQIKEHKMVLEELLFYKGMSMTRKMHMRNTFPLILWCILGFSVLALLINYFVKGFFPSIISALITIVLLGIVQIALESTYLVSFFLGDEGLFAWILPAIIYAFFQHFYHDRPLSVLAAISITALIMRPFMNTCIKDEIQKRIDKLYALGVEATVPSKVVKYRELLKKES